MNIVVGWIVLNLRYTDDGLLLIPLKQGVALLALIGLNSLLLSGIGVFVSLRASTVRQAQQAFGVIMLVIFFGPVLLVQSLPADRRIELLARLSTLGVDTVLTWVILALSIGAVLVNAAALVRFRRGRLVLD
jgi:hypothetical protein